MSERSTLTYASYASPREYSGTHARRSDEDGIPFVEEDDAGRASEDVTGDFCWTRAIKPGMLSFADGVGWT